MKYIIFTFEGSGYPLAKQLQDEGRDVRVALVMDEMKTLLDLEKKNHHVEDNEWKEKRLLLYKNIVEIIPADEMLTIMKKIKNPKEFFVFFDFNNLFYYAEMVKEMGFEGNFPTEKDRLFEVDRDAAKEFVRRYYPNLKITRKKEFFSIDEAKKFLAKDASKKIWILKGQSYEAKTFVPQTRDVSWANQQIIELLESSSHLYEDYGFFLEEKIEDVVEITPEKMYYNGKPVCLTMNFENKYFGCENSSVQVGCAQDLVFPIGMDSKIHDIAFPKYIDELAKKHRGLFIWDASILIDKKTHEMYFGEFCSNRPGYNSFFTEVCQTLAIDSFFESITQGENPYARQTYGASVRLFNVLTDYDTNHCLKDISISYDSAISKDVWVWDTHKKESDGSMRTVGYDKDVCVITGKAETIKKSIEQAYINIDSFSFPGIYYRPESDFLSTKYPTSILNRVKYCQDQELYELL